MILFIQSNIEYVVWPITLIILFIAFISVIVIFGIIESRNQAVEKYSEPINKLKQINKSLSFDNLDANKFNSEYRKSSLNSLRNFHGIKEFTEIVKLNYEEIKSLIDKSILNNIVADEYERTIESIILTKENDLPKEIRFKFSLYRKIEQKIFNSLIIDIPRTFSIKLRAIYTSPKGYSTTVNDFYFNHHDAICVVNKLKFPETSLHLITSVKVLEDSNLHPFSGPSVTSFISKNASTLDTPFLKKDMEISIYDDGEFLYENENLSPGLVGTVVDYLSRFMISHSFSKSFAIPQTGFVIKNLKSNNIKDYKFGIMGLDNQSIINACLLCSYDFVIRTDIANNPDLDNAIPNKDTIHNIRVMVKRVMRLNDIKDNFQDCTLTFKNGYTSKIGKGDADILANNCLIDLKTSKKEISKQDLLQISCYYLLAKNSHKGIYSKLNSIAIFNPRQDIYYKLKISKKVLSNFNILKKKIGITLS